MGSLGFISECFQHGQDVFCNSFDYFKCVLCPPVTAAATRRYWGENGRLTNIYKIGQIHLSIWTNTFINLDKYIYQFGQIHLAIWTNTFSNWTTMVVFFVLLRQQQQDDIGVRTVV